MILLDTTELVYAVGTPHPLREPCRRLLAAHGAGAIEVTTTVEVIQEFAHVRSRRRSRAYAAALARQYMAAFRLLVTQPVDLDLGLTLYNEHLALGAFDAVLAAIALNHNAEAIVSADPAFASVPQVTWVDPATPTLDQLIRHRQ